MTNNEVTKLILDFKESNSELAFVELWENTHNLANPYKYFDPSGARDSEDFLQITRIALWEAINTYDFNGRSTPLTWIRMRMTQLLIKEIRKMVREPSYTKVSLDDLDVYDNGSKKTVEEKFYHYFEMNDTGNFDEDKYYTIIARAEDNLKQNRLVLKAFQIMLVFPDMKRKTLATLLGVTKASVGKYFEIIRLELKNQADAL